MTAITKNVAQQSFFRFICFQIHMCLHAMCPEYTKSIFTCNASRWHRELWKYNSTCNSSRPQGEEPQHVGASSCFLFSIRGEPLRFCEFNDWKHKTFAHQDLRVRAKSARLRDRVISCVTLNAFSTFPSSVFSTLPILCKDTWTALALHSEVMQNMSSLVVRLCYLSYWFYQTQQQTLWSSGSETGFIYNDLLSL